ncbi:cytosolic factor, phosphatidylinositol/phosphatidylcholine transfer protein [Boothiomyces macroporosus]|uniref:Cytosolic factor, phosphatidylinositol/phosphatidylcholine transfer protein n=1 Tax=Boothiomyces macroporosus TaxID=261099 RepID=A0AAD5UQW8_9FUNG|nr:cytosolic factor, phosphatidylinositol/phosphatidylcholine transfer protein [Boothiomyces macroporosus]
MTPKEKHAIQALRQSLIARNRFDSRIHHDSRLVKFLRARSLHVELAEKKLIQADEWKESFNVQEIIDNFIFEEVWDVYKVFPAYWHKTDRAGRPILIQSTKYLSLQHLLSATTEERLIKNHIFELEKTENYRFKACSVKHKSNVQTICQIIDVEGVTMYQFNEIRNALTSVSNITSSYYPDCLGKCVVINAPKYFTVIWSIVKLMLDPRTISKVTILGSDYQKFLLKYIDPKHLPVEYGGECDCEGGCGNKLDIGPWNDGSVEGFPIERWERAYNK